MNSETKFVMVDVETTGVRPTSRILTLGAVVFNAQDLFENEQIYRRLKFKCEAPFTEDFTTMEWWNKQNPLVREEAFGGKQDYHEGLADFVQWYKNTGAEGVFSNHAGFDIPIIECSLRAMTLPYPWKHWEVFDYATLKYLLKKIPASPNKYPHVAIDDAITQARHCIQLLRYIN
jgi:DNA polymerase III epsilon subunit-like protein